MKKWKVKFKANALKASALVVLLLTAAITASAQDGNAGAPR